MKDSFLSNSNKVLSKKCNNIESDARNHYPNSKKSTCDSIIPPVLDDYSSTRNLSFRKHLLTTVESPVLITKEVILPSLQEKKINLKYFSTVKNNSVEEADKSLVLGEGPQKRLLTKVSKNDSQCLNENICLKNPCACDKNNSGFSNFSESRFDHSRIGIQLELGEGNFVSLNGKQYDLVNLNKLCSIAVDKWYEPHVLIPRHAYCLKSTRTIGKEEEDYYRPRKVSQVEEDSAPRRRYNVKGKRKRGKEDDNHYKVREKSPTDEESVPRRRCCLKNKKRRKADDDRYGPEEKSSTDEVLEVGNREWKSNVNSLPKRASLEFLKNVYDYEPIEHPKFSNATEGVNQEDRKAHDQDNVKDLLGAKDYESSKNIDSINIKKVDVQIQTNMTSNRNKRLDQDVSTAPISSINLGIQPPVQKDIELGEDDEKQADSEETRRVPDIKYFDGTVNIFLPKDAKENDLDCPYYKIVKTITIKREKNGKELEEECCEPKDTICEESEINKESVMFEEGDCSGQQAAYICCECQKVVREPELDKKCPSLKSAATSMEKGISEKSDCASIAESMRLIKMEVMKFVNEMFFDVIPNEICSKLVNQPEEIDRNEDYDVKQMCKELERETRESDSDLNEFKVEAKCSRVQSKCDEDWRGKGVYDCEVVINGKKIKVKLDGAPEDLLRSDPDGKIYHLKVGTKEELENCMCRQSPEDKMESTHSVKQAGQDYSGAEALVTEKSVKAAKESDKSKNIEPTDSEIEKLLKEIDEEQKEIKPEPPNIKKKSNDQAKGSNTKRPCKQMKSAHPRTSFKSTTATTGGCIMTCPQPVIVRPIYPDRIHCKPVENCVSNRNEPLQSRPTCSTIRVDPNCLKQLMALKDCDLETLRKLNRENCCQNLSSSKHDKSKDQPAVSYKYDVDQRKKDLRKCRDYTIARLTALELDSNPFKTEAITCRKCIETLESCAEPYRNCHEQEPSADVFTCYWHDDEEVDLKNDTIDFDNQKLNFVQALSRDPNFYKNIFHSKDGNCCCFKNISPMGSTSLNRENHVRFNLPEPFNHSKRDPKQCNDLLLDKESVIGRRFEIQIDRKTANQSSESKNTDKSVTKSDAHQSIVYFTLMQGRMDQNALSSDGKLANTVASIATASRRSTSRSSRSSDEISIQNRKVFQSMGAVTVEGCGKEKVNFTKKVFGFRKSSWWWWKKKDIEMKK